MKILILNGPNLNLLGVREPEIYGNQGFDTFYTALVQQFPQLKFQYYQSNLEGELIDKIQQAGLEGIAVVFNPGGYTHTSVAIADAIKAAKCRVLEVHITNIKSREPERHFSLVSSACIGTITGLGLFGYALAVSWFIANPEGSVN